MDPYILKASNAFENPPNGLQNCPAYLHFVWTPNPKLEGKAVFIFWDNLSIKLTNLQQTDSPECDEVDPEPVPVNQPANIVAQLLPFDVLERRFWKRFFKKQVTT